VRPIVVAAGSFATASRDLSADAPADHPMAVDVTDAAALDAAAARLAGEGEIAALVANAGILGPVARTEALDPAEIRRVIDTNLVSAGARSPIRGTYTLEYVRGRTAWG
jgi:NAD(P)-dependent dehydrogenase (short-subunit alcohol dehydrogenase family)